MKQDRKGSISETRVKAEYMERGYNVLVPENDGLRYDIVVERKGEFKRVQVKTADWKDENSFILRCYSSENHRVYTNDEIDCFALFDHKEETVYEVPVEKTPKTQMKFRVSETKNGQVKNVNRAKDYVLGPSSSNR